MPSKAEQIAALEIAYVEFRDLLTMLPDDWYARPGLGDWNLSQLLSHMEGWYREVAANLGRAVPNALSNYENEDDWNVRFISSAQPGTAALDAFDIGFHEFYAAIKALPESEYGDDGPGAFVLGGVGLFHFAEHRPQIEAWLAKG